MNRFLTAAAVVLGTAQAQHELPGEVLGTSIYYTAVSPTSVTVNWAVPDLGAYNSEITGYELEMAEVCATDEIGTPVSAEGFPMQVQPIYTDPTNTPATTAYVDSRDLRNAAALALGNTATTYNTYVGSATIGMSSATAGALTSAVATTDVTGATDVSSYDDTTVIDTLVAPTGGYGVYTMTACSASAWAPVTGVYTPLSGQNHEGFCIDACAASACSAAAITAAGTDAQIMASCSGCYPRVATEAGCFPGATGYPTTAQTKHTVTGLTSDKHYVFRLKASNSFGSPTAYGSQGYAVHTHTVPTAPLGFKVTTGGDAATQGLSAALAGETDVFTVSTSEVLVEWLAPSNFGTGSDDCGRTDSVAATDAQLACASKTPAEIVALCDADLDDSISSAENTACSLGACVTDGNAAAQVIDTCTTAGYAVNSPVTSYMVYKDGVLVGTTNGLSLLIPGLTAGSTYAITVSAANVVGEGVVATALTLKTPTAPAKPSRVFASAVTDATVELTLATAKLLTDGQVAGGHSALTGFRVFAQSYDQLDNVWTRARRTALTSDGEQMGASANSDAGVAYHHTAELGDLVAAADWLEVTGDVTGTGVTKTVTDGVTVAALPSDDMFTVSYLQASTKYHFVVAFVNGAGTSPVSDESPPMSTLEEPITLLRIYNGPPCVHLDPAESKVTFAASASGSNVGYRWELVYTDGVGLGALNEDGTANNPPNNDFDQDGSDTTAGNNDAGNTPRVMSGSTIARPGSPNCLSRDCSVMAYQLPLPGADDAVPNYDQLEIRVVAYNRRGIVRESTKFGWKEASGVATHDYQTIEYCGCTDPMDANYWDLATYSLPQTCTSALLGGGGNADLAADNEAQSTSLSTVIGGDNPEFEYYQFHYDDATFDIQLTLRVDAGAVDVYISTGGIANPTVDTSHIVALQKIGVTDYYVANVDYSHLTGHSSLYVSVRGATCVGGTSCAADYVFGSFSVFAHASKFRSDTADMAIDRTVLANEVAVAATVPSHYYQFYEFYYPKATNDIDIEISVFIDTAVTPAGAVYIYASKAERFPGPQRATGKGAEPLGYWAGGSHTGKAINTNKDAASAKTLFFTMKPQDDAGTAEDPNVLYLSVFGAQAHAQGTVLPSNKYSIAAKVYRYRLESDLMEPQGVDKAVLSEDRRYSVVTKDNFNYYEIPLSTSTYSAAVSLTVHYGEVKAFWSKTTLPTQDTDIGSDGTYPAALGTMGAQAVAYTWTITGSDLNLADSYVYLGLLGKSQDASYDMTVTLTQLNGGEEPQRLYNCKDADGVAFVGAPASAAEKPCQTKLGALSGGAGDDSDWHYFMYHISPSVNVDMAITERDGAGTAPADLQSDQSTWGTDWSETSVVSWVDDFTDEQNLDVNIAVTMANTQTAHVYASSKDPYPSPERICGATTDTCVSGCCMTTVPSDGTEAGVLLNVATFDRTWVYLAIHASTATLTAETVLISPTENTPTTESADVALAVTGCTDDCNNQGSCIDAACICYSGFSGATCAVAGLTDGTETTNAPSLAIGLSSQSSTATCVDVAGWTDTQSAAKACTDYAPTADGGQDYCTATGGYSDGWDRDTLGPFAKYARDGIDAREACCVCGGGAWSAPEVSSFTQTAGTGATRALYTAATEAITLDCSVDDCTPSGAGDPASGEVGYVACANSVDADTACSILAPAPLITVHAQLESVPADAKLLAYVDGAPYPRVGANSFKLGNRGNGYVAAAAATAAKQIKIYSLTPGQSHTVVLVLSTGDGQTLSISQTSFDVVFTGGCASGCSANGVCHGGYCVCFDGYYGVACTETVADPTADLGSLASGFGAGAAYRMRRDALVYEKLASNRFINSVQLEATATKLQSNDASLSTMKAGIETSLREKVYNTDSALNTALGALADIDTQVQALYEKKERNTIKVRQARQEAARVKTANLEAYLDHKRSLYAHQTEVQNDLAAAKKGVADLKATYATKIDEAFAEGRFIKNQLRTSNGPRTLVSDLKTTACSTDQFYGTECAEEDFDDALFTTTTATKTIDAAVTSDTGANVPR